MKKKLILSAVFLAQNMFFCRTAALATQEHGGPEGMYVHQISHIFFGFSLCVLIYWLRHRELIKKKGWRYIQYAAIFFILWTLDAFTVHLISEQTDCIRAEYISSQEIRIITAHHWLGWFYFLIKLDHLLCVPAIFFLYSGLKSLLKETQQGEET